MDEITPKQLMEEDIPRRISAKPQVSKEINAVIVFEITGASGGKWTLDFTKPSDWVSPGAEGVTPAMTMVATDADFVAVCTKRLNAQMAALQGKLRFKPMNMGLAMKLGMILG